jgi:hypothetical protein
MGCHCATKTPPRVWVDQDLPMDHRLQRRVYTYFYPGSADSERMLELWVTSWTKNGWSPTVLTPKMVKEHPLYPGLCERAAKLPTVNVAEYELQCYLRWLAFDIRAPGVFSDYDTINYSLKPEQVVRLPEGSGRIVAYSHCGHPNPGLFVADQLGVRRFLKDLMHGDPPTDTIGGRPHVSDMYFFFRNAEKAPGKLLCPNVGFDGWEAAPCVHYNNSGVHALSGNLPRPEWIQKIRPV